MRGMKTPSQGPKGSRMRHFSTEQLAEIRVQLSPIATELLGWLQQIEDSKFSGTIHVDGGDMIYDALRSLSKWLHRAKDDHRQQMIPGPDPRSDGKPKKSRKVAQ